MTHSLPWWQTTTIYQIYPRSFSDSNNDGIGDLQGIISKLDYLRDMGFETIWFSPFFKSPQKDFGYDISDYVDIAPEYGTLADVEELIAAVHARGLRILLDLVLNHTSDEHPWFLESRSSRDNPKRDWYIWKSGQGKGPPNNWKAITGGKAWHYDKTTDQYYFANFLECQPDLNWRNPEVKQAMLDIVRFWLDKGVDGFRLDIFHSIYKDAQFRGNPFSFHYLPKEGEAGYFQKFYRSLHQPETFILARELRAILDSYEEEKMMVGEVYGAQGTIKKYIGEKQEGFNMLFSWDLLDFKPTAEFFRGVISHQEKQYPPPFTPVYVFGNHDKERLISKIGGNQSLAKLLALFQMTVRGVPVVYYGEEIGMEDGHFPVKNALDPLGRKYARLPQWLLDSLGIYFNRDGCRTPMQWDPGPNAGFCAAGARPWLPVHDNRSIANVETQQENEASLLRTYQKLLLLRKEEEALQNGTLDLLVGPGIDENLLLYTRTGESSTTLIAINFGQETVQLKNPSTCDQVLLAVGMAAPQDLKHIHIPANAGLILGQKLP
jgi:oligo-1,6-glucosidase/alpha-glucosidase